MLFKWKLYLGIKYRETWDRLNLSNTDQTLDMRFQHIGRANDMTKCEKRERLTCNKMDWYHFPRYEGASQQDVLWSIKETKIYGISTFTNEPFLKNNRRSSINTWHYFQILKQQWYLPLLMTITTINKNKKIFRLNMFTSRWC